MSLQHRIEKHLTDNGKPAADFGGPITLVNDHRTKDIDGNATSKDANGDRIFSWDEATYGTRPTLSELPSDAAAETFAKTVRNLDKIAEADVDGATLEELTVLVKSLLEKSNMIQEK